MEPLSPAEIEQILKTRPDVTRADIEEYERLLAERFWTDPDIESHEDDYRMHRVHELYHKIFGLKKPNGSI